MKTTLVVLAVLSAALLLVWLTARERTRARARARLFERSAEVEPLVRSSRGVLPALRVHGWIAVVAACVACAIAYFTTDMGAGYAWALAAIVGALAFVVEQWRWARQAERIEMQLANALDLMVAALRAGASVLEALESATREAKKPLRPVLEDMLARIHYGEPEVQVFDDLAERVPLETFRMFAITMAVHGEVGGSLAPTLATVGKSIRDRIEIGRRVRSQSSQAQASVLGVAFITYFLALLVWRTNPSGFAEFVRHPVAANFVAAAMVLQAVGLLWIRRMARLRF